MTEFTATFHERISEIDAHKWDAVHSGNPFLSHAFLDALEKSESVKAETGWLPHHLALKDNDDNLVGAVPLYLKGHSQGEYVFDHSWADAYSRAGGRYYPKLLSAIPFTPANGPRLLGLHKAALIHALKERTQSLGISSLHLNFLLEDDLNALEAENFLIRHDQQFHWFNDNYRDFEDFLHSLSSRKRKQIRKERRTAIENGITIECLTGENLKEYHWDHFFEFYVDTGMRKWGRPYLNREFFSLIGESMADQILLIMCKRGGRYVAGAINFIGNDTLYGRHWGAIEDHPCLHFETCYYQAINYAIDHGLKCVEAGAQGPHKLARGYTPVITKSAHYLPDEGFRAAVERFLRQERSHVKAEADYMQTRAPFKKTE